MFTIRIETTKSWSDTRFDVIFFPKGDGIRHRMPIGKKLTVGWHLGKDGTITTEHIAKSNSMIAAFRRDGPVLVSLGEKLERLSPHYPVTDWIAQGVDTSLQPVTAANDS